MSQEGWFALTISAGVALVAWAIWLEHLERLAEVCK